LQEYEGRFAISFVVNGARPRDYYAKGSDAILVASSGLASALRERDATSYVIRINYCLKISIPTMSKV
jgi:hypothetical protein